MFGIVLDEWIGVTLPKTVFIQNARLGMLDLFLKLIVILYVVIDLIHNYDIIDYARVPESAINIWESSGGYKSASETEMLSDMCNPDNNDDYDYRYGMSTKYVYTNLTCTELSSLERAQKISQREMYIPTSIEEGYNSIQLASKDIVTSCTDAHCQALGKTCPGAPSGYYTPHGLNPAGQCLCECVTRRALLATGVNEVTIAFNHYPQWPISELPWLERRGEKQPTGVKELNMVTILRSHDGSIYREIQPDKHNVKLTVRELLSLAGSDTLDDFMDTAPNGLLDPSMDFTAEYRAKLKEMPHFRITGIGIIISVQYLNPRSREHPGGKYGDNPICYLDIQTLKKWQGAPVVERFSINPSNEEVYRTRYYYGVRVTFSVSGNYQFFDMSKLLVYLASTIVFLTVPTFFMSLFTKFCLGSLSEMYYTSQMQLLDSWDLFSGQVCRALVGMFTFDKMVREGYQKSGKKMPPGVAQVVAPPATEDAAKDVVPEKSILNRAESNILQWDMMRDQLRTLFKEDPNLDDNEIHGLTRALLRILEDKSDHAVHQKAFVDCVVNTDMCSLTTWSKLFDHDRKPCFLEMIFDTNRKARQRAYLENIATEEKAATNEKETKAVEEAKVEDDVDHETSHMTRL